MATRVLSDAELAQLSTWPAEVARSDLAAYFTLTVDDLRWVRSFRSPRSAADRLGLAVQLCALRFLGFVPADLASTPVEVVERLADRIGVPLPRLAVTDGRSAAGPDVSTSRRWSPRPAGGPVGAANGRRWATGW